MSFRVLLFGVALTSVTRLSVGVVDITLTNDVPFFGPTDDTFLFCYYTGTLNQQNGFEFGIEIDTGSGTTITPWRSSGPTAGGRFVQILAAAGDFRVGAFSCEVTEGAQTQKAITFKIKTGADVWPAAFTVTSNRGEEVTLQMEQKTSRTSTLEWRKDGNVLSGQTGLSLTIASAQSSDEGIYECYYQGAYSEGKQGIMRLIVRDCAADKWGPPSCTGDCPVCYNGGVCDDNTGECVCPPGFQGTNCETACTGDNIGTNCDKTCWRDGDCPGHLLCVMDPYGCSCAPGLMGIECITVCPDGMYGASCTQTCHCTNGPAVCDKKTGACTGGCLHPWVGDSCQIESAYLSHFTKTQGMGLSRNNDEYIDDISPEECARRCLQGTATLPLGQCRSFDYVIDGSTIQCVLSKKNTDDAGANLVSDSRFGYYHRNESAYLSHFTKTQGKGLALNNDETIDDISPEECARRCLQGTTTVPLGRCRSFDFYINGSPTQCLLSRKNTDDAGANLVFVWTLFQEKVPPGGSYAHSHLLEVRGHEKGVAHSLRTETSTSSLPHICLLCDYFSRTGTEDYAQEANTSLSLFDFYDEKALDGFNTERIGGISKEDCATRCLMGTSNVPLGACLSFDYDNNGSGACILSIANMYTPGATLANSNPVSRFDYYHRKEGSMFEKYDNQALSGFNDQSIGGISPGDCALRCLQGTTTVPAGSCKSFDYDRRRSLCVLSTDSIDTQPSALGPNNNNDYYHRKNRDECAVDTDNCHAQATCTNTAGSFTCACNAGFTGNGVQCTDINECDAGTDNCDNQANCTNTEGSFNCTCDTGYTGDGLTCSDMDECTLGAHSCDAQATCTNTAGSFSCTCNTGYTGDGVTCTDIDDCVDNTDDCHQNAACTNTPGSFTCTCGNGYYGNGTSCEACGQCSGGAACNTVTGVCFSCQSPWTGQLCQQTSSSSPVTAIVGGTVAAVALVCILVAGLIFYRRKHVNSKREATTKNDVPLSSITSEEDLDIQGANNEAFSTSETNSKCYRRFSEIITLDDVTKYLKENNLGEYAEAFRDHEVDGDALRYIDDAILKDLIPKAGPRAKFKGILADLKQENESQVTALNFWEIQRTSLKLGKRLGSGQFGEVRLGELRNRGLTTSVAVKTLRDSASDSDKKDLLGELEILVTVGRHDNIISLVGACTKGGPLMIVVEYAPNGCLKDWLKANCVENNTESEYQNQSAYACPLSMEQLIQFGVDVANGMSHLAAMQCIHRDLAARNILLGENLVAKVSDFGLSRDIYEDSEYVKSTKSKLPLRWMAYESLFYNVYTTQSDIWSFGVLLWEIMTMGNLPYEGMKGKRMMDMIKDGGRLEKPSNCPDEIYTLMASCWETLPEDRPTFPALRSSLIRIMQGFKVCLSSHFRAD
ncbi:FGFR3 [Branchiostoma lanceolatum]|uniref:receptor protein-tyrosine kinase n=1 Tax=Branchiostoma lanceolatum TaxID=7740 RepID=A0A8K0EBV8_BRALA|nr:FGFR3 [Branchiostoma lanceolatum]